MTFKLRFLLLLIILVSTTFASARHSQAGPDNDDSLIKRLNTLLNQSGREYRVKVRITSRSNDNDHRVVYLKAVRAADPQGDKLQFQIKGDDISPQEICLKCLPAGGASACEPGSGASLPEPQTVLPGSILPWEEVLVGACANWVADTSPPDSTSKQLPQQVYRVRLGNAAFKYSWASTIVTMDTDSGDPLYFDRVDPEGALLRRIRVLEIGATGSWRGIRRAIIELPEGRVLMEVISFRKGAGKSR